MIPFSTSVVGVGVICGTSLFFKAYESLNTRCLKKQMHEKHFYEIEICTPAKELTMSLDKYAHLITCKIWRRNWNKRKYVPRIQFSFSKNEHQNEVVWLNHLKRAVKYQCSNFPRHVTLLTRRNTGVKNTTLCDTSRFLTRRVPI